MLVRPVTFESTSYYSFPIFQVIGSNGFPLYRLDEEKLASTLFLCQSKKGRIFISSIKYDKDFSYFVDNVADGRREVIKVVDLKEFWIIES